MIFADRPAKLAGADGKKDLNWALTVVYGENSLLYAAGDMDVVRERNWTKRVRVRVRVRVANPNFARRRFFFSDRQWGGSGNQKRPPFVHHHQFGGGNGAKSTQLPGSGPILGVPRIRGAS